MQNFVDRDLMQVSRVGSNAAAEFSPGKKISKPGAMPRDASG
jgi:hypothetical protein